MTASDASLGAPLRSPLLDLPGAVEADPPDAGVAGHYGDPFREQRLLASGQGLVDRSARHVVRVDGPDRLSWLHSLSSQALDALPPGQSADALILSPQGHVEHQLRLVDDGGVTWIGVEPGTAPSLVAFLQSMRFMLRVEVADVSADYAVVSALGRRTDLSAVAVTESALGADHVIARNALGGLRDGLAGLEAYEALRVAAGVARLGRDTDHRTLPHEIGWIESAVHLNKGCYRGQETVARVYNLGRPPRRLVRLHLDGSVDRLPAAGSPVISGDDEVGFVGTAVRHYELGPIALALVKRNLDVAAELSVDGIAATQEEVVAADTGPRVVVPKMGRGIVPRR